MGREFNSLTAYTDATVAVSPSDAIPPLRASIAIDLKARARHYRRLADMMFDARVAAIVEDCAGELEQHACAIEQSRGDSVRPNDARKGPAGFRTLE
jgi:hypothetical protein